jgi:ketosteroid isomerase-like protein
MTGPRLVLIALASLAALAGPALAAQSSGPNTEVMATVDAVLEAFTSGDIGKLGDQYAPDCTFIDEFAPFLWTGPHAIDGYFASGARMYQETQHRDGKTTVEPAAFVYVSGDRAFVVEPLSGTATVRGRPYDSRGAFAFTLARIDGRWKITSQTWTKASENMNPY